MEEDIIRQALAWHEAQQQEDADWEAFGHWLSADSAHRAAYDDVALIDSAADRHRDSLALLFPNEEAVPARRRWFTGGRAWGVGGAAAAAIAVIIALPLLTSPNSVPQSWSSTATAGRSVTLADGSTVELAPASRLVATASDRLALDGAAYFDIRHDPQRALQISAGDYVVRDIGTRFEISGGHGAIKVAVADGQLTVASSHAGGTVSLNAGQRFTASGTMAEVEHILADDVGAWRRGRLVYDNAPLALVAADLSRYAGKYVEVDTRLAGRRFSGVLTIGNGTRIVADLQQLMGLESQPTAKGVRLVVPGAADSGTGYRR